MDRSDSRLLPVAALNERRRRAVKLKQVCISSELSKGVVIEAVAVQEHRGPEKVRAAFSMSSGNRQSGI